MRPDKHKKKSHAAYAKKAAAKGGKSSRSVPVHSEEVQKKPLRHGKEEPEEPQRPIEQPSGNSQTEQADNRPSFSRRKIESNWQQYEEIPEDEETTDQRGADFSLLLNQTAGGQFRFKNEEALDEDASQMGISSILSFDCNQLTEKLQSIALPERLEIARIFFDRETLEILNQDAATSKPVNTDNSSELAMPPANPAKGDGAYFDEDLENLLSESSTDVTRTTISSAGTKDPVESVPRIPSDPASDAVDSRKQQPHHTKNSEDDVLDFLLSLSSTDKPEEEGTKDVTRQTGEALVGELETNNVCPNGKVVESGGKSPAEQNPPSGKSQKTESLDDWLDSILDDD